MLGDTQHIAIGIFEPGDVDARRRRPNSGVILRQAGAADKLDARCGEGCHGHFNLGNFPAYDRKGLRPEIFRRGNAKSGAMGIENNRETVFVLETMSECVAVKGFGASRRSES